MRIMRQIVLLFLAGALLLAGCGSRPSTAEPPLASPAPHVPNTPPPVAEPITEEPKPVSSAISLVQHPWVEAPGAVTVLAPDVRIRFTGPVDRASVEEALRAKQPEVRVSWQSDTELVATYPYCNHAEVTVAGARDAAGNTLEAADHPTLKLGLPCHGLGHGFTKLSDRDALIPGWPEGAATVLDADPESGLVVGKLSEYIFLLDPQTGEARGLARAAGNAIASFLPGKRIAVAGIGGVQIVGQDGVQQRLIPLEGAVLSAAIAPTGKEALVVTAKQGGILEAIRVDLEAGSVANLGMIDRPVDRMAVAWVAGAREVRFQASHPAEAVPDWFLHVDTGAVRDGLGRHSAISPNGRWEALNNGVYPIGQATGEPVMTWADSSQGDPLYAPVWSADSRLIFTATGQIVDLSARRVVNELATGGCGPLMPLKVWANKGETYVTYVMGCH